MMEGRIVRTELLPAAFMYCGFLLLLLAARTQTSYRTLLVGLTSFLAALAMLNKVQFLLLILAFPPILVAFGHRFAQPITWQSRRNEFPLMIAYGAVAVLPRFWRGRSHKPACSMRPRCRIACGCSVQNFRFTRC